MILTLLAFPIIACVSLLVLLKTWTWTTRFHDPDLLAANADFVLPESARNVQGDFSGFNNFVMYGKFEMDAVDFASFAENANCSEPFRPISLDSSYLQVSQFSWWEPGSNSLICRGGSDGCFKVLIVDVTDDENYTVYVHAGCG